MGIAAIILLAITYLAGIVWFSLAQWIAMELDGERRVRISIRLVLALVWPLTILIATGAVMARLLSEQHQPVERLEMASLRDAPRSAAAGDSLVHILAPRDIAR
ncbi:hypothetical protein N825_09815 [Skermanella stibiiresistens SB22]|uniref:Uncharacterized protein n=1 Tax=Skermanella stibiiresistens SB22 TaxID=1385369 RepID=W9GYS4_9PROT|nr:hypothetical protein [Skermanella stibiiresistens]EWY36608.1 hypothetical protein N825_09815 [Skermanella stibiiresistens SB22]